MGMFQVLQCTILRPLFAARKFLLVGDPEQLPPVVRSRAARLITVTLFLILHTISSITSRIIELNSSWLDYK